MFVRLLLFRFYPRKKKKIRRKEQEGGFWKTRRRKEKNKKERKMLRTFMGAMVGGVTKTPAFTQGSMGGVVCFSQGRMEGVVGLGKGGEKKRGLEEFFGVVDGKKVEKVAHGRAWEASELRMKSYEDLHKLWYVLLKERNLLLTERHLYKRVGERMPSKERLWKVKLSMARVRTVCAERKKVVHQNRENFLAFAPPVESSPEASI